jgi:cytochrome c biogenesis protein CcmG/thiol:disulfide interchange protein DsbE
MTEIRENSHRRMPLRAQVLIWVILLGLLTLVGFGLSRSQQGTIQPGAKIPDFSLELYSGYEYNGQTEVMISDLKDKIVFINFWASWCKPCEQEAPVLEEAWNYYLPGGKVVFLGVDYVDTEPAARIFLKKYNNTYPNGPDIGTVVSQLFRIKGVPETYILDTEGVLRYVKIGPFISVDEIKADIEPLFLE